MDHPAKLTYFTMVIHSNTVHRFLLLSILCVVCSVAQAQDFYIVFLNKREDKAELPEEEVKKLMDGHMANISRLAKEGKLWAAGPFDGGGGLFIFKTSSLQDVKDWVLTDPAVRAERWNVEMFPYFPRTGSVCRVGDDFVMTNYHFIRYSGPSASAAMHLNYLASSTGGPALIAEASLGEGNGSVLVLSAEPAVEWVNEDPAVKTGHWNPVSKKLYIARGSFCEAR